MLQLTDYDVSAERGFLPAQDPLPKLPKDFQTWEAIAHDLPKLLAAGRLRAILEELKPIGTKTLQGAELDRAMLLLSYFGHGYVWEHWQEYTPNKLPRGVAIPWAAVARRLDRPPVLSYASYSLNNWRRIDPSASIALGNIVLLQNFLGGIDEEWFILVHVEIEAKAGAALVAIPDAQAAIQRGEIKKLIACLKKIDQTIAAMNRTLERMPEGCDPYIYYNRVRPYIHGWKDNLALPNGLSYEGVGEWEGQPQKFRGETGAQSTIIPSLDAALGIAHSNDRLKQYLMEMRDYMPPKHRQFLAVIEQGPSIRNYVEAHSKEKGLEETYNQCVEGIAKFRSTHLEFAQSYIANQAEKSKANPTQTGTGGTPFVSYLSKHRDDTARHKL